jgi:hypothetical protein
LLLPYTSASNIFLALSNVKSSQNAVSRLLLALGYFLNEGQEMYIPYQEERLTSTLKPQNIMLSDIVKYMIDLYYS